MEKCLYITKIYTFIFNIAKLICIFIKFLHTERTDSLYRYYSRRRFLFNICKNVISSVCFAFPPLHSSCIIMGSSTEWLCWGKLLLQHTVQNSWIYILFCMNMGKGVAEPGGRVKRGISLESLDCQKIGPTLLEYCWPLSNSKHVLTISWEDSYA